MFELMGGIGRRVLLFEEDGWIVMVSLVMLLLCVIEVFFNVV